MLKGFVMSQIKPFVYRSLLRLVQYDIYKAF